MHSITLNLTFDTPERAQSFFAFMAGFFADAGKAAAETATAVVAAATEAVAEKPKASRKAKDASPAAVAPAPAPATAIPAPAPAVDPLLADAPAVTIEALRAKVTEMLSKGLRDPVLRVFGNYGATSVSTLKPEFYSVVMSDFEAESAAAGKAA